MMKFTNTDEEGSVIEFLFDKECWLDTFPLYLRFLRASGFSIADSVKLHAPDIAGVVRSTREEFLTEPEEKYSARVHQAQSHSSHFYDTDRNK